jgi:hypothetical protein
MFYLLSNQLILNVQLLVADSKMHGAREQENDEPSWDSKQTPSAIRTDVLSQLD